METLLYALGIAVFALMLVARLLPTESIVDPDYRRAENDE